MHPTAIARDTQDLNVTPLYIPQEAPLSILDFADMISPTDEEIAEGRSWLATTHERFEANMARNAILNAWELNAISAEKAVLALIENNAFDFDLVLEMIATHAKTCAVIEGEI